MSETVNTLILLLISLIGSTFLIIIVHELGHLVFGLLTGYRFLLLRFWNIAITKPCSEYRLHIVRKPESYGQCIMYPEKASQNPKIMMYGGIIFNLLYGILFLTAGRFINDYILQNMCRIAGSLNFISAVFNYASKYMTDDGQGIREMKRPLDILCYNCQLMISRNLMDGASYKDMDRRLFVVDSLHHDSSSYEKEIYFYEYYRLLELGCLKEAERRLHELERYGISGWLAAEVCRERIFFYNLRSSNRIKRDGDACINPNDVRIYCLEEDVLNKFKRYIYPGEVRSTMIILGECKKQDMFMMH